MVTINTSKAIDKSQKKEYDVYVKTLKALQNERRRRMRITLRAARTTAESVKKGEVQKEYEEIKRFVESL